MLYARVVVAILYWRRELQYLLAMCEWCVSYLLASVEN